MDENGNKLIVKQSEGTDDEAVPCPRSKKKKIRFTQDNIGNKPIVKQSEVTDDEAVPCPRSRKKMKRSR